MDNFYQKIIHRFSPPSRNPSQTLPEFMKPYYNVKDMNIDQLETILRSEPKYRLKQAKEAVFKHFVGDWDEVSALPAELRAKLNQSCPLKIEAGVAVSKDGGASKALLTLNDGLKIESVLMRHKTGRNTVCVSSQVGCLVGCAFCATSRLGFKRNLEPFEIAEQVLLFARILKKEGKKVANVVFMGMGEPFLNYKNAIEAAKILNDPDGLNIGARHISISTSGIVEGIKKFADEKLQANLAISLNAPNNNLRSELMPINKKYPIEKILAAVDEYIKKTKRKVMFEYLLLEGVNDSPEDARQLALLMKKPLYFVNLILYNPTGAYKPPDAAQVKNFKEILIRSGIETVERYRFGRDIEAACGQLVAKNENS